MSRNGTPCVKDRSVTHRPGSICRYPECNRARGVVDDAARAANARLAKITGRSGGIAAAPPASSGGGGMSLDPEAMTDVTVSQDVWEGVVPVDTVELGLPSAHGGILERGKRPILFGLSPDHDEFTEGLDKRAVDNPERFAGTLNALVGRHREDPDDMEVFVSTRSGEPMVYISGPDWNNATASGDEVTSTDIQRAYAGDVQAKFDELAEKLTSPEFKERFNEVVSRNAYAAEPAGRSGNIYSTVKIRSKYDDEGEYTFDNSGDMVKITAPDGSSVPLDSELAGDLFTAYRKVAHRYNEEDGYREGPTSLESLVKHKAAKRRERRELMERMGRGREGGARA